MDATGLPITDIIQFVMIVGAVASALAVGKWRQDNAEKQREEDRKAFAAQRAEDRTTHQLEVSRARERGEKEIARVEAALKEAVDKLEAENRLQRDAWVNHNMSSEDMREMLVRIETNYEHMNRDLSEMKLDVKEIKRNGNGHK